MELDLDSSEGYFEQLRQMMIFGEAWVDAEANTIRYRPDEHPWDILQPAGRRGGKTTAVRQWVDEIAHWAATHDRRAIVRDVAGRGLTPPELDDTPLTVRWSCTKPADTAGEVLHTQVMAFRKEELVPGFGDLLRMWLEKR